MSANLIIEASKCTLPAPEAAPEELKKLQDVRRTMLPAEAAFSSELDARVAELERCERGEEKGRRLGLSILSPEVFCWQKDGLPAFAAYAVDGDGECVISTDPAKRKVPCSCKAFYENAMPQPLTNRIQKVFTDNFLKIWCASALAVEVGYFYSAQASASPTWGKFLLGLTLGVLASFCASLMFLIVVIAGWMLTVREAERTAVAKFTGAIPYAVKKKIQQLKPEFKEVIILGEATWNLTQTRVLKMPAACDPLVLGWDGDYFWLIDRFDTSSLEQLASDEFAVKADDLSSAVGRL